MSATTRCPNCGTTAPEEAAFCPECGGGMKSEVLTAPRASADDEPALGVAAESSSRRQFNSEQSATTGPRGSAGFAAVPPLPPSAGLAADRMSQPSAVRTGFFASLFDWGFTSFVTPRLIKIGYVISAIFLAISWLVFAFAAFVTNGGLGILVLIIGGLISLLWLIMYRLLFEFLMVVFRAAVDVHDTFKGRGVG